MNELILPQGIVYPLSPLNSSEMDFPHHSTVANLIDPQPLPRFARVRYEPDAEIISNSSSVIRSEMMNLSFEGLSEDATVAVGVGSRGIHDIDSITEEAVSFLNKNGYNPVIVPAMGSHGGASSTGQREVLNALGITEDQVGARIDTRMETEVIGEITVGETTMPVHFSSAALEADAVFVINRVKAHTNFSGEIESGLSKMTVVGLGKQKGANAFHSTAIEEGYVDTLQSVLSAIEASVPLIGGLALVENFYEKTAQVEAVPASEFNRREPELLERAYKKMARLPVENIDLLVVDELGKEISGAGMDTNVIGRYRVLNTTDPETPDIQLIYARGLTERTKGNGTGIGLADITRQAAIDQIDIQKTYANTLTSGSLAKAKIPVVAPDDDTGLRIALSALGGYDPETVRIAWIANTQNLTELHVSESLVEELPKGATIQEYETLEFDDGTRSFRSLE